MILMINEINTVNEINTAYPHFEVMSCSNTRFSMLSMSNDLRCSKFKAGVVYGDLLEEMEGEKVDLGAVVVLLPLLVDISALNLERSDRQALELVIVR